MINWQKTLFNSMYIFILFAFNKRKTCLTQPKHKTILYSVFSFKFPIPVKYRYPTVFIDTVFYRPNSIDPISIFTIIVGITRQTIIFVNQISVFIDTWLKSIDIGSVTIIFLSSTYRFTDLTGINCTKQQFALFQFFLCSGYDF